MESFWDYFLARICSKIDHKLRKCPLELLRDLPVGPNCPKLSKNDPKVYQNCAKCDQQTSNIGPILIPRNLIMILYLVPDAGNQLPG